MVIMQLVAERKGRKNCCINLLMHVILLCIKCVAFVVLNVL